MTENETNQIDETDQIDEMDEIDQIDEFDVYPTAPASRPWTTVFTHQKQDLIYIQTLTRTMYTIVGKLQRRVRDDAQVFTDLVERKKVVDKKREID